MGKHFMLILFYLYGLSSKSQTSYFNELIEFKGSNYSSGKVIVDDKIYILNTDSDAYVMNKLNLNGTVISSIKYYTGIMPINTDYTNTSLFLLNNRLISVFNYYQDSTIVLVTDTLSGAILYSKKYGCSSSSSELLENNNLVIHGSGIFLNIDANTGNVISSFSYPTFIANNGIGISGISKNKGTSFFIYGYKPSSSSPSAAFIAKIDNNQTMANTGFHYLPYKYSCSTATVKNNGFFFSCVSGNGAWSSNWLRSILKSDTIFNSSLKTYQGTTASNNLTSTSPVQCLYITNNNLLLATNPNDLVNYTYNDLIHKPEVLSFDLNLNYIKTIQYPAYTYSQAPVPKINYYKGNTYISTASSSTVQGVPFSWVNGNYPSSFKYFWMYKADSIGETSCTTPISYSVTNFTISDSVVAPFSFTPITIVGVNAPVTFSNTIITSTITCSSVTGINDLFNQTDLVIYPNPTSGFINIVDENNQFENSIIEIKNYLGQVVFASIFNSQIDLHNLSAGMYFLTVENGHNKQTIKIIKE